MVDEFGDGRHAAGYVLSAPTEETPFIVIQTCALTQSAEEIAWVCSPGPWVEEVKATHIAVSKARKNFIYISYFDEDKRQYWWFQCKSRPISLDVTCSSPTIIYDTVIK